MLLAALVAIWLPLHGFGARLSLLDGEGGSRTFEVTVATSFLALLALVAVIGFAVRYRAHGEDLDSWLALGATLTLFAELHYVLTAHVSSDYISQGDFLRLLSYGLLLVGVWRAISFAEFGRAVAEERARVAREIHDGLAQYLFAVSTHASMLESGAPLEQTLPKLKEAAAAAQQEARFAVLALSSASGTAPFDAALRRYVEFLTADGVAGGRRRDRSRPSCSRPTSRSRCSGSSRRGSRTCASTRAPSARRSGSASGSAGGSSA